MIHRIRVLAPLSLVAVLSTADATETDHDRSIDRVQEGLAARSAPVVADRVQGAILLELYLQDIGKQAGRADLVREAVAGIERWYTDESELWVRYHLFRAVGELHDASDRDFLLARLNDTDPTFRAMAAEFAGAPLAPEIEDRLVSAHRNSDVWWVRTTILETLGNGSGDTSLALLHEELKDPCHDVRAAATDALSERADKRSIAPLSAVWDTIGLLGADSAIGALASIADPDSIGVLEKAARSPYPFLRRQAAEGLGTIGALEALHSLVSLLDDPDPMVAQAAARALTHLKSLDAVRPLLLFIKDHDDAQTVAAALQMGSDLLGRGCDSLLAEPQSPEADRQTLTAFCDDLKSRQKAGPYEVFSTADLHSVFYSPYNANARRVAPRLRIHAAGWIDAVGEENGGERLRFKRGTQVTIWHTARYLGATWLEVSAGPYGEQAWIREQDVRPIPADELADRSIYTEYGAGSLIQIRKDPPPEGSR